MAYKMKGFSGFGNSPLTQKAKVDPDAPGTPGKPGYEPPVKREDLDAKGKAIWDAHRAKDKAKPNKAKDKALNEILKKRKTDGKETTYQGFTEGTRKEGPKKKKSPIEQKGKQVQLSVHEKKKGTMITGGSDAEVINDLEDRIEFLNSDLQDSDSAIEKGQIKTQLSKLNIRLKKERAK